MYSIHLIIMYNLIHATINIHLGSLYDYKYVVTHKNRLSTGEKPERFEAMLYEDKKQGITFKIKNYKGNYLNIDSGNNELVWRENNTLNIKFVSVNGPIGLFKHENRCLFNDNGVIRMEECVKIDKNIEKPYLFGFVFDKDKYKCSCELLFIDDLFIRDQIKEFISQCCDNKKDEKNNFLIENGQVLKERAKKYDSDKNIVSLGHGKNIDKQDEYNLIHEDENEKGIFNINQDENTNEEENLNINQDRLIHENRSKVDILNTNQDENKEIILNTSKHLPINEDENEERIYNTNQYLPDYENEKEERILNTNEHLAIYENENEERILKNQMLYNKDKLIHNDQKIIEPKLDKQCKNNNRNEQITKYNEQKKVETKKLYNPKNTDLKIVLKKQADVYKKIHAEKNNYSDENKIVDKTLEFYDEKSGINEQIFVKFKIKKMYFERKKDHSTVGKKLGKVYNSFNRKMTRLPIYFSTDRFGNKNYYNDQKTENNDKETREEIGNKELYTMEKNRGKSEYKNEEKHKSYNDKYKVEQKAGKIKKYLNPIVIAIFGKNDNKIKTSYLDISDFNEIAKEQTEQPNKLFKGKPDVQRKGIKVGVSKDENMTCDDIKNLTESFKKQLKEVKNTLRILQNLNKTTKCGKRDDEVNELLKMILDALNENRKKKSRIEEIKDKNSAENAKFKLTIEQIKQLIEKAYED